MTSVSRLDYPKTEFPDRKLERNRGKGTGTWKKAQYDDDYGKKEDLEIQSLVFVKWLFLFIRGINEINLEPQKRISVSPKERLLSKIFKLGFLSNHAFSTFH